MLDPYDDKFKSLGAMLANAQIPPFIKQASTLSQEQLSNLPDHCFAAVLVKEGGAQRKYPCVDVAHTTVNTMYFLKEAATIPERTRTKIAQNLLAACQQFEIAPPDPLLKLAKCKTHKPMIKSDGATIQTRTKESDLVGSPIMPVSARPGKEKVASAIDPYLLAENTQTQPIPNEIELDPDLYALSDQRLPLASYDQVKTAVDFFYDNGPKMHPRLRHQMCTKIAARSNQLGYTLPDLMEKYGSATYAPEQDIKAAFILRKKAWCDDKSLASVIDSLLEKKSSVDPDTFAEALAELDISTGIDQYWDNGVSDPWLSTFGKQAQEDQWRWTDETEYLTEDALKKLVNEDFDLIRRKFGDDLATGIRNNPITVFESLPRDTKKIIARMAQQAESNL